MRKLLIGLSVLALLLVSVDAGVATGATHADTLQQLAAVRQATVKYHDVTQAVADGYIPVSPCEALPGVGAMGIHYLNPALALDLAIDPTMPEVLLYAPSGGSLRLVGVEYFVANAGQPHPQLFGRAFDGPMAGHGPGMPEHYDLHAWLWQANPEGVFAQWNPSVSCG